jgi:hypothetical protein
MRRRTTLQATAVLALGAVFGYLAASSDAHRFREARATSAPQPRNPGVCPLQP